MVSNDRVSPRAALLLLSLALGLALPVAGCGGGGEGQVQAPSPAVAKKAQEYNAGYRQAMVELEKNKAAAKRKDAEKKPGP